MTHGSGTATSATTLTSTSANRTIPPASAASCQPARGSSPAATPRSGTGGRYAQAATRRIPRRTLDADVDRDDQRDRVADVEPRGPDDPEHRRECGREGHQPVDPRSGRSSYQRASERPRAMNARADGRDREGQAVVELGHRDERDLLARGRRGLEVRGERRRQQEQDLDQREQDRARAAGREPASQRRDGVPGGRPGRGSRRPPGRPGGRRTRRPRAT